MRNYIAHVTATFPKTIAISLFLDDPLNNIMKLTFHRFYIPTYYIILL